MEQFYLLLLEKSLYTDEAYLFALLALLLSLTDCGRALSIASSSEHDEDVGRRRAGVGTRVRQQPDDTVPHWHIMVLRFQARWART